MDTKKTWKDAIIQSNQFIENRDELSLIEFRLLYNYEREMNIRFYLLKVNILKSRNEEDNSIYGNKLNEDEKKFAIKELCKYENREVEIKVTDFFEEWNVNKGSSYKQLRKHMKEFSRKGVGIENEDGFIETTFATIIYPKGASYIKIIGHESIIPYIVALDGSFTMFYFNEVKNLSSASAMRLHELIRQYKKIGKKKWPLKDFKKLMYCEDKYSNRADFEKKMVKPNIPQINEYTLINVDYEITGRGNNSDITFYVTSKNKKTEEDVEDIKLDVDETFIKVKSKLSTDSLAAAINVVGEELAQEYIDFIIKERIMTSYEDPLSSIKNINSYMKGIIQKDEETKNAFLQGNQIKTNKAIEEEKKEFEEWLLKERRIAEARAKLHLEEVYLVVPEYKEVIEKIEELASVKAKAILTNYAEFNGEIYTKEELEKIEGEFDKKSKELLLENGFSIEYITPKYKCNKCNDTCINEDGLPCECREERIKEMKKK